MVPIYFSALYTQICLIHITQHKQVIKVDIFDWIKAGKHTELTECVKKQYFSNNALSDFVQLKLNCHAGIESNNHY
jgi:hypothetical protein